MIVEVSSEDNFTDLSRSCSDFHKFCISHVSIHRIVVNVTVSTENLNAF